MPVVFSFSALITTTWSPVSRNGVYFGFSLPIKMRATCDATRPRARPEASTTYHLRAISPALGKYVDMLISQKMKTERRPLSIPGTIPIKAIYRGSRIQAPKAQGYRAGNRRTTHLRIERKFLIVNEETGRQALARTVWGRAPSPVPAMRIAASHPEIQRLES